MRNLIDACHGIKVDEIRRIFPSISMSILPFIHLSIHLPIIYPSVHTIHQSIHSPINPSVLPSDSTHQPYIPTLAIINHPSIHDINLFIHLSIHQFTHQSICLSIHLQYIIYHSGVHTFLHPSIFPSIHPLIHLSVHPSTIHHLSLRCSYILTPINLPFIHSYIIFQCLFAKIGTKREPIVILDSSSKNRINNEAMPRKESLPFKSKPEPQPKSPVFQPQASSLKQVPEDESIKKFKREITELLLTVPNRSIQVNRIPEAFSQHFHRPYLLTEYGGRKTSLLLQKIPDVVKVDLLFFYISKRWWCNGQHCCLPSSRSGFDSRPTHCFFFFYSLFFFFRLLVKAMRK